MPTLSVTARSLASIAWVKHRDATFPPSAILGTSPSKWGASSTE